MAFITGTYAIIAPASALNNGKGEDNVSQVKTIPVQHKEYPYVSAQAVRYWLRNTLSTYGEGWQTSPIIRPEKGKQQTYTEGNPMVYDDDDLFGYMRAEKGATRSRIAPFRLSTLVSSSPAEVVRDFGVMARHEDNPLLFAHEFYRSTLVGSFSIDLSSVGTFTYENRSGFLNLSSEQCKQAEERGLRHLPERKAYQLEVHDRMERVSSLLRAFGRLEGGANRTLHYTDVAPSFVMMAVSKNGNNPFMNIVAPAPELAVHEMALDEVIDVYGDDFLSPLYIGLRQGVGDASRMYFAERDLYVEHPRQAFEALSKDIFNHAGWFE